MLTCNYCKTELSTKSALTKHIKTSRYCIEMRESVVESKLFDCEYCKGDFTSKHRLTLHRNICRAKKEEQIVTGENVLTVVSQLQKEVAQLKEKPTITVNNTNTDNSIKTITNTHNYSSLLDCSTESITETFKKHYNKIEHLLQGDQKHLADVTVEHLLSGKDQPMYFMTDRSRNKFMYTPILRKTKRRMPMQPFCVRSCIEVLNPSLRIYTTMNLNVCEKN